MFPSASSIDHGLRLVWERQHELVGNPPANAIDHHQIARVQIGNERTVIRPVMSQVPGVLVVPLGEDDEIRTRLVVIGLPASRFPNEAELRNAGLHDKRSGCRDDGLWCGSGHDDRFRGSGLRGDRLLVNRLDIRLGILDGPIHDGLFLDDRLFYSRLFYDWLLLGDNGSGLLDWSRNGNARNAVRGVSRDAVKFRLAHRNVVHVGERVERASAGIHVRRHGGFIETRSCCCALVDAVQHVDGARRDGRSGHQGGSHAKEEL